MTFMTRVFGNNVDKATVMNLLLQIGEDNGFITDWSESWTTESVRGKCNIAPRTEGIDIDLYVFRTDVHYANGHHPISIPDDYRKVTEVKRFHKIVPYKSLGE